MDNSSNNQQPRSSWFGFKDGQVIYLGIANGMDDIEEKNPQAQHCTWLLDDTYLTTLKDSIADAEAAAALATTHQDNTTAALVDALELMLARNAIEPSWAVAVTDLVARAKAAVSWAEGNYLDPEFTHTIAVIE